VLLLVLASPLHAQDARVVGQVQWVAGTRTQVLTEDGTSFDGYVTHRRRIVAREIWRDNGRGEWSQSP
jgi:hypothetical protein